MKYNIMVTLTRTITSTVEFEVSARDEETAQEKAENLITKASEKSKLDDLDWEQCESEDDFEYEVSEA